MRKGEVQLLTDLAIGAVSGGITLTLMGMLYLGFMGLDYRDSIFSFIIIDSIYPVPCWGILAAISGAIGAYTLNTLLRRVYPTTTDPRAIISILGGVTAGLAIFPLIPIFDFINAIFDNVFY